MNGQYHIVQLIFVCISTSVALIVFLEDRLYNVAVYWLAQVKRLSAAEAARDRVIGITLLSDPWAYNMMLHIGETVCSLMLWCCMDILFDCYRAICFYVL